jgi:hypothetical protein
LTAIGGSRSEYFREVQRQLRRFVMSLDRMSDFLSERQFAAHAAVPTVGVMRRKIG